MTGFQTKALQKKVKFLGNYDIGVASLPSVAISREIGREEERSADSEDKLVSPVTL